MRPLRFAGAFLLGLFAATTGAASQSALQPGKPVVLDVAGRALTFRVAAETIALRNDKGRNVAEAGVIAILREREPARPVTFAVGGGPGTSSAFLNLGAAGPWRIGLEKPISPVFSGNSDTWLDFTDLVFVDPPGTGLGRLKVSDDKTREFVWSVDGDIDLLADAIAAWLRKHQRLGAPVALAGQSYGGFRAPRLTEALHRRHGVAVKAMILISPILDYGWRYHARTSPLSFATLLPSLAAARMEAAGTFDAHGLRPVEDYAGNAFIDDFLRGARDSEAQQRLIERVTAITGLPADVVSAAGGRVDEQLFSREFARAKGQVVSSYDPSIAGDDPDPASPRPDFADPFLAALKAPLTVAMSDILKKHAAGPKHAYIVANDDVFDHWQWNADHGLPESVSALRKMLALDPTLRVLVAHGFSDLQTPYFESTLILNQVPDFGGRIAQRNYRGGHMFYSRDDSRAALRNDVRALLAAATGQR